MPWGGRCRWDGWAGCVRGMGWGRLGCGAGRRVWGFVGYCELVGAGMRYVCLGSAVCGWGEDEWRCEWRRVMEEGGRAGMDVRMEVGAKEAE